MYATGIGLMLKAIEDVEAGRVEAPTVEEKGFAKPESNGIELVEETAGGPGFFENIFKKTKEWFEAEPDMDFGKK